MCPGLLCNLGTVLFIYWLTHGHSPSRVSTIYALQSVELSLCQRIFEVTTPMIILYTWSGQLIIVRLFLVAVLILMKYNSHKPLIQNITWLLSYNCIRFQAAIVSMDGPRMHECHTKWITPYSSVSNPKLFTSFYPIVILSLNIDVLSEHRTLQHISYYISCSHSVS